MLSLSCKSMRSAVIISLALFVAGTLLLVPAVIFTAKSAFTTVLFSYLGFTLLLLSPVVMIVTVITASIPGLNERLHNCQH